MPLCEFPLSVFLRKRVFGQVTNSPGRRGRARIAQNARALAKAGGAKAMIKQLKKGLPTLRKLKKRARTKNQR